MGLNVGTIEYELGSLAKERARDIDAELSGESTPSMLSRRHRKSDVALTKPYHCTNYLDWPGGATEQEIVDLRSEGYSVRIDAAGVRVGWYGSWCGDVVRCR